MTEGRVELWEVHSGCGGTFSARLLRTHQVSPTVGTCFSLVSLLIMPHARCTSPSGISGASYYEGYFSNVSRSPEGDYVAVSSRGNFYMTWQAGQTYWQPHNRPAARRVQV